MVKRLDIYRFWTWDPRLVVLKERAYLASFSFQQQWQMKVYRNPLEIL